MVMHPDAPCVAHPDIVNLNRSLPQSESDRDLHLAAV
jgi:hypothetical protein